MLFDGLSEASVKAVLLGQEESRRLDHQQLGSETLLLGLMGAGGLAAQAISAVGLNLARARFEVEKHIGRGRKPAPLDPVATPRVKRIFHLSWSLAQELEGVSNYLSTKHLLLGLIDESENRLPGGGVIILRSCEVDISGLRIKTLSLTKEMSELDLPPKPKDGPSRPKGGGSPINRGPWPPDNGPDDPARVPLHRKPSDDGSEIALPLPRPDDPDL
jgi:ATP-dependent Clp protease ATP-binding subunit ClpC